MSRGVMGLDRRPDRLLHYLEVYPAWDAQR
jgi:hypothetical protein